MSERSRPGEGAASKSAGRDFVYGSSPTAAEHLLAIPELPDDVDILTAALAYIACGWYVVPVRCGTKDPGSVVGKGWQRKSSRDPKVITAWFSGADHGIALH